MIRDCADLIWSYLLQLKVAAVNEELRNKFETACSDMSKNMRCSEYEPDDPRRSPEFWFGAKPWYADSILEYEKDWSRLPDGLYWRTHFELA